MVLVLVGTLYLTKYFWEPSWLKPAYCNRSLCEVHWSTATFGVALAIAGVSVALPRYFGGVRTALRFSALAAALATLLGALPF